MWSVALKEWNWKCNRLSVGTGRQKLPTVLMNGHSRSLTESHSELGLCVFAIWLIFDIAIVPCWMQPTQCVKREHSFGNCACLASQALARPEQDCQAAADDKLETSPPFCRPTTGSVNLSSMDHVDSMMKNYVERDDGHFWHSLYKLESVCPEWPGLLLYRALQTMSPAGSDPHRFLTNSPNFG